LEPNDSRVSWHTPGTPSADAVQGDCRRTISVGTLPLIALNLPIAATGYTHLAEFSIFGLAHYVFDTGIVSSKALLLPFC
jgi:hypothetical protein